MATLWGLKKVTDPQILSFFRKKLAFVLFVVLPAMEVNNVWPIKVADSVVANISTFYIKLERKAFGRRNLLVTVVTVVNLIIFVTYGVVIAFKMVQSLTETLFKPPSQVLLAGQLLLIITIILQ